MTADNKTGAMVTYVSGEKDDLKIKTLDYHKEISGYAQSTAATAEELTSTARSTAGMAADVASAVESIAECATSQAQASENLAQIATELQNQVSKFKL